ncbi:hypothetical protein O3G_MSEX003596 [Manduca sexta]|uniref:Uncharacterized protein n=1 Tax=Manduca sexta TaxID=7130 RepID=A0A922CFZ7_MANSE|nr:hypothetical protein O3G_MSEX003596 [Manduca sexta]
METNEFDATLGGAEHLPLSANNLKFAASRSVEIAALTELILRPSATKLIFQTLPVHMRRRAMSHNCKRLPKKLRDAYFEQLKKSGISPKQKRPSRKHRRRPKYLLEEYNRRQKRNMWLETHIWHAKRFHMTECWGYRLAYAPCDKAFRACYRGSSAHCLMQDISYLTPIQIEGPVDVIKDMFSTITNSSCNLSIGAKAYISGNREGTIHVYNSNTYPFGYIGKVQFMWIPSTNIHKTLCLFVHPAIVKQIELLLMDLLSNNTEQKDFEDVSKKRKLNHIYAENIQIKVLSGMFNRFRLTGPNSHAILVNSLKCVDDIQKIKHDDWVEKCDNKDLELLKEKDQYWSSLSLANSPSQLPPQAVIGLVVRDPRLRRPNHRTKALCKHDSAVNTSILTNIPPHASTSALWNLDVHETIKKNAVTNSKYIQHVTKTQLVPGEINENDPFLQSLPVVLVQRPGSQDPTHKKIGYGCGWDIIMPSGYGLPFWLTFIMFGARPGGLRETESLAFEMGECYFPPDSEAGRIEEEKIESELKNRYFRLPPSKRVNFIKLGINAPFICPWRLLLQDWSETPVEKFFILRDRQKLNNLQVYVTKCMLR